MAEEPEPLTASNFVQLTALQTWSNLPLVVAGGLIFALISVPAAVLGFLGSVPFMIVALAVLVSPAWATLIDLLLTVAEDRPASIKQMPKAFARLWSRSVRLSLLQVVPLVAAWLTLPLFTREHVSTLAWIGLAADLLGLAAGWSIALYAYPLIAVHDLSTRHAIRNGVILASRYTLNTVGMVSMAVLGMVAVGFIGIVLLLFLPPLYGMFVVNNYRLVMQTERNAE